VSLNCVSDFLCVGAQKGGTTTLRAYLCCHPQICIPKNEIHFFDNDSLDWRSPDYGAYWRLLRSELASSLLGQECCDLHSFGPNITGEVTPIYMYWRSCAERIYRYNPEMKLIFLLRNPMARAYSHWSMEVNRGYESLNFSACIREEPFRIASNGGAQHRIYSYIDRGRYYQQIEFIRKFFDPGQMLFLSSETFFLDPLGELRRITDFLGIQEYGNIPPLHKRMGGYIEPPSLRDWSYVYDCLKQDIDELECFLGWDLFDWRRPWHGVRD